MLARTPLSTKAKPYTPAAVSCAPGIVPMYSSQSLIAAEKCSNTCNGSKQSLTFLGFMAFETTVFAQSAEDKCQITSPEAQQIQRGRNMTLELPQRLPSRTPSPSARSVCLSEVSTEAERTPSQAGSFTCTSISDINEYSEGSLKFEDAVVSVKNTFIDSIRIDDCEDDCPKLSRCQSAPGSLLSCPFKIYTMPELHEMGRCKPCAYLYRKEDGCRRGSECIFCHSCSPDELKKRKKIRAKAIRAKRTARKEAEEEKEEQAALAELGGDVICCA